MRVLTSEESVTTNQVESVKQQYVTLSGQAVSNERFIFACYDTIKNLSRIEGGFRTEYQWPELGQPSSEEFAVRLQRLVDWHYSNHIEYHPDRIIDLARLTYLSVQLAHLEKDFRRLCQQSMLLDEKTHRPVQFALDELVAVIKRKIGENLAPYLVAFFTWIYLKPIHVGVDFNQVPPVGRYAKMVLRSREKRNVELGSLGRPDAQLPKADAHSKLQSIPRSSQAESGASSSGGKRNNPNARQNEGFPSKQTSRQPGRQIDRQTGKQIAEHRIESDQSLELEKAAITLVETAIKALEQQATLNEVTLDPQNSYYRRLQHQKAEDLGFKSESVGEGKQRSVKILKNN